MFISGIHSVSGASLDSISQNPHAPTINQIAAPLDANSAETSAVLQLIQSAGQAPQTQVGHESAAQSGGRESSGGFSVYA